MNRRKFLRSTVACGAHVMAMAAFAPSLTRHVFATQEDTNVAALEKWGRLEQVYEGVWALISTPFGDEGDFTTVCNGGIIAGDDGVLAIESYMTADGASWVAQQAKRLTGRWPTDVVSTHFHADHTGGHKGYFNGTENPRIWLTESTKVAAEESFASREMADNEFQNVSDVDSDVGAEIDLGNRKINLVPRSGHTSSDLTVELVDPKVIWCGDLFFNRMFPNYGDAIPTHLNAYATSINEAIDITYIPGHGPTADVEALRLYKDFLGWIEQQAKEAWQAGTPVEEATKEFALPDSLSAYMIWSPDNAPKAFTAWYRELDAEKNSERLPAEVDGQDGNNLDETDKDADQSGDGGELIDDQPEGGDGR